MQLERTDCMTCPGGSGDTDSGLVLVHLLRVNLD